MINKTLVGNTRRGLASLAPQMSSIPLVILLVAETRGEVRSIALLNSAAELERKLSAKTAQVLLLYSQSGYVYRVGFCWVCAAVAENHGL